MLSHNFGIVFHFHSCLQIQLYENLDKTAELSERRPRDAPNILVPSKFLRVLTTHPATYPEICNGLLFRSILRMCVQNLKFVPLPVPEIIGGTQKNWRSPWICPRSIFSQIFTGLLFAWTLWVRSFTHSWDNRGYFKKLGSPWIRPRSLFSQIFKELLFALTMWIYLPSLKFVALPVPEIIGGTQKNWRSPWICPRSIFSQNFKGLLFGWNL